MVSDAARHPPRFADGPPADGPPIALVHGNCQAESLRRMLPGDAFTTVRIPPVHELDAADLPLLRRWLERTEVLITQPIRRGYRNLPIGTAEVIAAAPGRAAVVLVPVVRFAGLYPEQVIIRPPHDPAAAPPLVAYHSLRTLAVAAGRRLARLRPATVREIARRSIAELAVRERRHGTVVVSDLLHAPTFALMRTINHPGNPVFSALAARVCARLGVDAPVTDPGRPLLAAVRAPREAAVIEAFGLDDEAPDGAWTVDGRRVSVEAVHAAHLEWYARHPRTVEAGLIRHHDALDAIGLR